MGFNPSTVTTESTPEAVSRFDPETVEPESATPTAAFNPKTVQPEKPGLFKRAIKAFGESMSGAGALAGGTPGAEANLVSSPQTLEEAQERSRAAETPLLPEGAVKAAIPLQQRLLRGLAMGPAAALSKPSPDDADAGVIQAGNEFVRSQSSPLGLALLFGLGQTGTLAKAGSKASKVGLTAASGGFAAQMGKEAGTQAGEAVDVVKDPNATPAQKAAAITAPVLTGSAAVLAAIGMSGEAADLVKGKEPVKAIDDLTKAIKEAPDEATAKPLLDGREQYVNWWAEQLQKHDELLKSPQGAQLLKEQLSTKERAAQRRAKVELQAKIDSVGVGQGAGNAPEPEQKLSAPATPTPASVESPEAAAAARATELAKPADQVTPEPVTLMEKKPVTPAATPVAFKQGDPVVAISPDGKEVTGTISGEASSNGRFKVTTESGSTMRVPPERLKLSEAAKPKFDPTTVEPEEISATLEMGDEKVQGEPAPWENQQPPPEEPAPAPKKTKVVNEDPVADYARYQEIQGKIVELTKAGKDLGDPKVQKLMAENEAIKNRNSSDPGMPPEKPVEPPKFEKGRGMKIGEVPDGTRDLLNNIDDLGGVRGPIETSGGEYDGYGETFNKGPARLLRNKDGRAVDQIMQELEEFGHKFESADDFYRKVQQAVENRQRLRAAMKQSELPIEEPFNLASEKQKAPEEVPATVEDAKGPEQFSLEDYLGSQHGKIDPALMRFMAVAASGAGGGAYGFSQGKTPEERIKKALSYGATAAIVTYAISRLSDAAMSEGGIGTGIRALRNSVMGRDVPNMRAASEKLTDAAYRLANARAYGLAQGVSLAAKVLRDKYQDPVFAKKLGAVLIQDMQEAKLDQLTARLKSEQDPVKKAKIQAQIANVRPVYDMPDNGGIKSAEDFAAALKDPDIKAAIARHKELVQAAAEAAHKELGGKLAAPGPNTGAFINTEAIDPEGLLESSVVPDSTRGNLQNPLKRKSAFNKERSGTAEQYEVDYNNQVARMASGNAERIAQRDYYKVMENEGLGIKLPAGERPENAQKFRRERTQELSTTGELENTWVRKDIFGEHRQLMNTDSPIDNHVLAMTAKVLNTIQLKSLTDPTFHIANIISAITGSPGGGSVLADLGRQIPGVNVSDALVRVISKLRDVHADTPEIRAAAAEIARIGALREGHPGVVSAVDRAGRLVMNDLYDNLVKQGLVKASEGGRRDFINQVGQYNTRLMGKTKAFMKEAGFSPFIVAGQNFNRLAFRKMSMLPGVKAASAGGLTKMIAINLAGMAVTAATTSAVNYLLSGRIAGPPGTPIGAIGWISKDAKGNDVLHTVDPLKWTNLRRGLRITGANALAQGMANGRDLNHSGGQAYEDIKNGFIHPWAGPAVNAASVFWTGKSISGFQEAEKANPLDHTNSPTLDQAKNNALTAATELNPHVAAAYTSGKRGTKDPAGFDTKGALLGVGKSLLQAVGIHEGKPGEEDRGPAETALYDKEISQHQRITNQQSLAERWPRLNQQERIAGLKQIMKEAEAKEAKDFSPAQLQAFRENQILNLRDDIDAVKKGVSSTDRMIKDLGIEDGSRANYLAGRILARPPGDAQRLYFKDQYQKGNMTPTVLEQVFTILQKQGWKKTWGKTAAAAGQ